jgi:hypothetical protein
MAMATDVGPQTVSGRDAVLRGVRRLLVVAVISALAYSAFTTSSRGGCDGGIDADGRFIGADGTPVAAAPICVSATLGPDPVVFWVLALGVLAVILWSTRRSARASTRPARVLTWTAAVVGVGVATMIVVAQVTFFQLPDPPLPTGGTTTDVYRIPGGMVHRTAEPLDRP